MAAMPGLESASSSGGSIRAGILEVEAIIHEDFMRDLSDGGPPPSEDDSDDDEGPPPLVTPRWKPSQPDAGDIDRGPIDDGPPR